MCSTLIKEKTLIYSFRVKYLKGKASLAADAFSRHPVPRSEPDETDLAEDEAICAAVVAATACALEDENGTIVDLRIVEVQARQDEDYRLRCARTTG